MIFIKKLTSKEVLEVLAAAARETLPEDAKGVIDVTYTDDGVEIVYRNNEQLS